MNGLNNSSDDGPNDHSPVYEKLRSSLIQHEFKPGEHLMITDLAVRYGVSPTPVREALNRLREETLISFVHGRGYFCRMPDLKELSDLYQMLRVFLIFAVDDVISRSAFQEVERIAADFEAENGIDPISVEATALARAQLVESALGQIIGLAGNRAMSKVAVNMMARTHMVRVLDMETPDSFGSFSRVLGNLARAIRRSDREMAERLINTEVEKKITVLPGLIREAVVRHYLLEDMDSVANKNT